MAVLGPAELRIEFERVRGLDAHWGGQDEGVRDALEWARSSTAENARGLEDLDRRPPAAPAAALDRSSGSLRPYGILELSRAAERQTAPERGASAFRDPVRRIHLEAGALLIIGGPPGVGKTHLAERLDLGGARVLCPDRLRDELVGPDVQEVDGALLMGELLDQLDVAMEEGRATVLTAPALKLTMLRAYVRAAISNGRAAHVIYLDGDRQLCDEGQSRRARQIPGEILDGYIADWEGLRQDLLDPDGPSRGVGAELMRQGYRSISVMDRPYADTLEGLRFG
ncbi:AAA family ATPase [Miltoncostaea oceani]|uniref:AAA family ATPase n=1 Tax=Miltoncostaea oceani TaxID=2843216 RepID=UPI001C3E2AF3|nr:AAA family ATPase [Miltoncostaea oceani]